MTKIFKQSDIEEMLRTLLLDKEESKEEKGWNGALKAVGVGLGIKLGG